MRLADQYQVWYNVNNFESNRESLSMRFQDELFQRRDKVIANAKKYGGSSLRVYGSVARGGEQADSGLDLLVALVDCCMFDPINIKQDAADLL